MVEGEEKAKRRLEKRRRAENGERRDWQWQRLAEGGRDWQVGGKQAVVRSTQRVGN